MAEQTGHSRRRRIRARTEQTPTNPNAFLLGKPGNDRPGFGMLGEEALEQLKDRTLELLSGHGIAVVHPDGIEALLKAGAKPAARADCLRLPRELVAEALAALPTEIELCGKSPARDLSLPRADGAFVMRTGTGAHGYVDPEDRSYRNLDLKAVAEMAAVANGLDEIGFIAHPFVHGVPEITADIHSLAALIQRTDKHVWIQPYEKLNVEYLMRLASIAAGGEDELKARPLASCITCSFTPLEFKEMDTEAIIQARRFGLPLHACSLPTAGGTAPLSTGGSVVMAAAEILAMACLAHVLAPGTPVIATPLMFSLDMRTGSALQSSAESIQAAATAVQLMKRGFGMVTHTYGAGSDTPDVDVQSMAERTLLGQAVALSGGDILGGVGQLECATVFSPVQAVLDNEAGAMIRRFMQPPEVDDAALNWEGLTGIRTGGHFLDAPHTLEHCREQLPPKSYLRQGRDDYEASDRRTAFDAARETALALIHESADKEHLGDDAKREIADVVAAADRHIVNAA